MLCEPETFVNRKLSRDFDHRIRNELLVSGLSQGACIIEKDSHVVRIVQRHYNCIFCLDPSGERSLEHR